MYMHFRVNHFYVFFFVFSTTTHSISHYILAFFFSVFFIFRSRQQQPAVAAIVIGEWERRIEDEMYISYTLSASWSWDAAEKGSSSSSS
jgi:hypothetical protein